MDNNDWLKSSIDKIEQKVDTLGDKLSSQNITLEKQSVILEEHVRRTDLAEENISLLRENLHKELEPIKRHVNMVSGVLKFFGYFATGVGVIAGLTKIISSFWHL